LVWAGLAETGAGDIYEARLERRQRSEIEPVAPERPHGEILDQHVRLLRELADQLAPVVRAQVDGDRFLGAIADEVVRAVLRELRLERPRLVARAGLLDLDDARAELGEDHR